MLLKYQRVDVRFLGQPDKDVGAIGDAVRDAMGWPDARTAWLAVAWAKRSGLTILEPAIKHLRSRRKAVRALIGVDQHGATEEALLLTVSLFTEARIYHDTDRYRTFHPKLYVVEGASRARAVVGSGNLTEGGLSTNYETAFQVDLDLTSEGDVAILNQMRDWFDLRWSNPDASRELNASTIARLVADPTITVVPEAFVLPPSAWTPGDAGGQSVFGPAVKGLRLRRTRPAANQPPESDVSDVPSVANAQRAGGAATPSSDAVTSSMRPGLEHVVLAAGLPKDRQGQAGFNARIAHQFFGVYKNGDEVLAEGIDKNGVRYGMRARQLVYSAKSNQNHRMELRDPSGRKRGLDEWPIVLVEKLRAGRFRYLYLYPGDSGYAAMKREIARRGGVGDWRKAETKRVYLTLGEVVRLWPSCPF